MVEPHLNGGTFSTVLVVEEAASMEVEDPSSGMGVWKPDMADMVAPSTPPAATQENVWNPAVPLPVAQPGIKEGSMDEQVQV